MFWNTSHKSEKQKELLSIRHRQEIILKLEPKYFQPINAMAMTYRKELALPETEESEKPKLLEQIVDLYKRSVDVGSLEAEPYIFLSAHFKKTNQEYANKIETKGVDFLIGNGERLSKLRFDSTTSDEAGKKIADLHASLAYLCERYTERTRDMHYKNILVRILGGIGLYDEVLRMYEPKFA